MNEDSGASFEDQFNDNYPPELEPKEIYDHPAPREDGEPDE